MFLNDGETIIWQWICLKTHTTFYLCQTWQVFLTIFHIPIQFSYVPNNIPQGIISNVNTKLQRQIKQDFPLIKVDKSENCGKFLHNESSSFSSTTDKMRTLCITFPYWFSRALCGSPFGVNMAFHGWKWEVMFI